MTTAEAPAFAMGLYPDMDEADYHADPVPGGSLSSTGARRLLAPGCPAKFKHELDHGQSAKKTFDLGRAAHRLVLGVGADLVEVEGPRWDTNEIKARLQQIRAEGDIPLKPAEYQQVHDMADALRCHPEAGPLLDPAAGDAEQSLFWTDGGTGINRRARVDFLRHDGVVVDYKTCHKADLDSLSKDIHTYGYHQQEDWYLAGLEALGYGAIDATDFLFVFQEKTPPYVVTVVRLDAAAHRIGHDLNQAALHLYASCTAAGYWPGYSDQTEVLGLPAYAERLYQ